MAFGLKIWLRATALLAVATMVGCGSYPSGLIFIDTDGETAAANVRRLVADNGFVYERPIDPKFRDWFYFSHEFGRLYPNVILCRDTGCDVKVTVYFGADNRKAMVDITQQSTLHYRLWGEGRSVFDAVALEARKQFGPERIKVVVK